MDKYSLEVVRVGGDKLLKNAIAELGEKFVIVARDPDMIVLGNEKMNVCFSRKTARVKERFVFEASQDINRKR